MKKELGYRIRKLRESRDFTQENMAAELGITAGAYAKIERGETDPSFTRLHDIANILGVSVSSLVTGAAGVANSAAESITSYGAATRADIDHLSQLIARISKELEKLKAELAAVKKKK